MLTACLVLLVLSVVSQAFAQETNCTDCHSDKVSGKSLHAAVQNGCKYCHIGIDASTFPHEITNSQPHGLTIGVEKLCFGCHKSQELMSGTTVHPPAGDIMCTMCHDPHASKFSSLLKSDTVCFTCHNKDNYTGKKVVHAPVAAKMCASCHEPHSADREKLLKEIAPKLCFNCHDEKTYSGFDKHAAVSFGMCLSCHEPHQSQLKALTREKIPGLCFICHHPEEVKAVATHKSIQAGQDCSMCHNPHTG